MTFHSIVVEGSVLLDMMLHQWVIGSQCSEVM
jgi:hypothetical protein